jgi:hypothetical protein
MMLIGLAALLHSVLVETSSADSRELAAPRFHCW